ncbi:GLUG motif-containing protein [Gallibacter intestinalis]|uniref:GLUG domain-containing protein n=1 Tax=Gallibacter intestinalis TaxID=2779356 RepID=A0ABR9QWJ4_9FIRM|nr:GLUG motif-containing protein [Gallibacter intestinalis]MBE5035243.1 hypothetical protein [Gallibacter intestinalis]
MRKKSFKSALTVLLSLMMILVMFPANAFAMDGEGTKENPYEIAAASELYEFATKVNAGETTACAVLTADITISIDTNWTPIGNDSNQYNGIFDGGGHTITGLSVDIQSDNTIYAGLFGYIGEGGTIKNLSLADSKITCSGNRVYAGGVCGWNTGTIQNCYNTGDVSGTGTSSYGYVYAGGVCGWNTGTIQNCYNTGDVSGTGTSSYGYVYAGGVCGWNTGTIQNCYNTGEVSGASTSTFNPVNAGGVCGDNAGGTIQNCYNTGDVSGEGTQYVFVGGVCGTNENSATIINCYNTRDVSGTSSYGYVYAGGVCGANGNSATIINCYNTGDVSGTSSNGTVYAGGVCGYNRGDTTQNCYWLAGTADCGIGNLPGDTNAQSKTADEFASGEAAWLLNNGAVDGTQAFYQTCGVGLPQFSGETVYKVKKFKCPYDSIGTYIYSNTDKNVTGEHSYGEPEWNWSEDGTSCTVTFTCKNNPEHKETPQVSVTSAVKTPATCTESGVTTYTAAVEFNGQTYTDTKEVSVPATGHELKKTDAKEPTCTEDGNKEYWTCDTCDKYFSDENAETEIQLADTVIEATGHSYDNGKCTVCGEIDPDFKAVIIEGANGTWQKGTKDGLSFTSNATFADFQKVQVDGKDLDASNYTVKEGSTIVTLKAEYLETLSVGKHTLAIVSETGTAETEFTIKAAPASDDTQSPQTGDNSNMMLWITLMFIAVCGLTGAMIYGQKKKYVK